MIFSYLASYFRDTIRSMTGYYSKQDYIPDYNQENNVEQLQSFRKPSGYKNINTHVYVNIPK